MKKWLLFICCVASVLNLQARVRVSLLTCSPGDEAYSLYGHTAIRVENPSENFDYAFNYGVFSFDQPNFIWRFVLGECDYMILPVPWRYFEREYRERGSSVTEQELNLTDAEAEHLMALLLLNSQPENREYRYDFFRDNCTTRVRDMIERVLTDDVVYPDLQNDDDKPLTHRRMLHQYNGAEEWSQEGCDILLGAETDTILSQRATMFLPEYMMRYAEGAVIRDSINNVRPLVRQTRIVVPQGEVRPIAFLPYSPKVVTWSLLVLFAALLLVERFMHYQLWMIDIAVLLFQGVVGILLLFMMLVSHHPGVHHNWLLWPFTPLALWGMVLVVKAAWRGGRTKWHAFSFAYLTAFLVFSPWIPQEFGNIIVPLTLSLLTRPISYLMAYGKDDKKLK